MDSILSNSNTLWGIIGSIGLGLAGILTRKYLVPFLQVDRRRRYAQYIGLLADEVTDELRLRYPDRTWIKHLDEAVDRLIEITGISADIARRAINAAAARK